MSLNEGRIYFGAVKTIETTINGSIGTFQNPSSISVVSPIQITLFAQNGQAKSQTLSGSLSNFQTSSLNVGLYSSSNLVGESGQTLSISIQPANTLNLVGSIILNTPEYYANASNDYFFDASRVDCQNSQLNFISCSYSPQSRQLTIRYSFISSSNSNGQIIIFVTGFKNPIKPNAQGGFYLTTLDSNNFAVGASPEIFLNGVTQPQQLSFVTVGFDSRAQIGKYSSIKLNVGTKQALGLNCFVQIVFPQEFTLDNTLTAVDGIGIFQGLQVVRIDQLNKTVQVKACTQIYGAAPQQGTITFRQVKNPNYVTSTGSFQVTFGVDSSLSALISTYQQGAFVPESFFDPGDINNIQISPKDPNYGALTSYDFIFTPSSDLRSNTGTQIVIDFPSSLVFPQNYCAVVAKSDNVSVSITCSLSGKGKVLLNYVFSNKPSYVGSTPISLSIFGVQNPTSQFDLGTFKIQTFMSVNSTFRLVDSGTNQKPVMAQTGSVQKTREVAATSQVANERDVTYTFSMKFTNPVPVGGSIRITFTDSAIVGNSSLLANSCYRLDFSNRPTGLVCKATPTQIDVTVSQPAFDSKGLEAGDEFRLQVSPITNRRDQFEDSIFTIQSFDAKGNQIDKTTVPSNFTIRMTSVGKFGSFQVQFDNQVNGKLSSYTFAFSPMVMMQGGDVIEFQLPKQIGLPFSGQVPCQGDNRVLFSVNCVLVKEDTIRIVPTQINYPAIGDVLTVTIPNIRNPYSNAPTDSFQNVSLIDNLNRIVATGLKEAVTIQTSVVSKITGSILVQTPKDPGALAVFTLQFNTNNPVPKTAAMQITAPIGVSFNQDSASCTVITDLFKTNLCRFNGSTVLQIRQAFADQDQDYSGRVEVSFNAYNPPDNTQKTLSLKLEIFTDTSFRYLVDIIDDGLAPKTQCNWPCLTCDALNPDLCTSCPLGSTEPQFLQSGSKGTQSCKYSCDKGQTFSTENGTKRCIKCDEKCATCLSTSTSQDSQICTSCSTRFPYFWPEMQTCFDSFTQCPAGSYQFSKFVCSSCPKECVTCTSPFNCVKCDQGSQTPLRQSGKCVSDCSNGRTRVITNGFQECQSCVAPCEECAEGNPNECTKCQSGKRLFKIGSQCLPECPLGMTEDLVKMECRMCEVGCDSCDPNDPSKCLRCQQGLVFYNGKCETKCPADQNKSSDGTVCEKRVYPLNKKFLPFPFVFTASICFFISVISYLISNKTTLINQSFIAFLTVILQLAIFFEILKGISDEQAVFVAVPIVILVGQAVLNIAFTFTFFFQIDDFQFNTYKEKNTRSFAIIMMLSLFVNFHIFRLTFCKFLLFSGFNGAATNPIYLIKPLKFYSLLHIAFILVPYMILNTIGAVVAKNAWGENQLQMTMVEICILSFVFALGILFEQFFQNPKKMLFQPSEENTLFKGLFKTKSSPLASVAVANDEETDGQDSRVLDPEQMKIIQERNDRFEKLEDVIRTVKLLKDKRINNEFDNIMEVEMGEAPDRICDTSFDMAFPLPLNDELTINLERLGKPYPKDQDLNKSYPGLNESYDGNEKRLQLLEFFASQAIEDAENERRFIEKLAVRNRQKDQETMYDGALIDNCFFAPKSMADNVTQTVLELKEQGIDPLDLIPVTERYQNEEPDVEPELPRKVDDDLEKQSLEDTMMSNRPLLLKPKTVEVAIGTEDFQFQQQKLPIKEYLQDQLPIIDGDPQIELTMREQQQSRIIKVDASSAGDLEMIQQYGLATPTSNNQTANMMNSGNESEDSFYSEAETVLDRRPDKKMWLLKADQLKTIILNDIEIAKKQKEPYKGLQLKKESTEQSLATDRTLSPNKLTRVEPSIEQSLQSAQRNKEEPDGKIEEAPIKEEDYDEIDALFYKNNYPYDENYTVSSIHTSQLESIPLDKSYRDDFTAWMKDAVEINQRTFNVFEVLGNFALDSDGQIIDRERTIMESNFLDRDGLLVNEKGYFINELTGAIRSKYTFEDLFMPEVGSIEDLGELPMPYRLEKFNFNPHKIMGCFDFDSKQRPIFLKNKYKNLTDNHFRPVNQCGFLINEKEDIIDNEGHVRFTKRQLGPRGSLPLLFNYKSHQFDIKDIIGRFNKDDSSKEIIMNFDDGKAVDLDGRLVNATGYLIDNKGHIVNKNKEIIFNFYEVLFNEPPKIFHFTDFSIEWIKGCLNKDVTKNPFHDDEFDLIGRRINTMGYLVNNEDSVVDQHGKEVFKAEILTKMYGQDAEIPEIFRNGKLRRPLNWSNIKDQAWQVPKALEFSNIKMNSEESKASFDNTNYKTESQLHIPTELTKKQFTGSIAVTSDNSSRSSIQKKPPSPLQLMNIEIKQFGDPVTSQKQAKLGNKRRKK